MHKICNSQNLKKDVLEGIEEKVIRRLEILIAKWQAVKRAYEVDPQLLRQQISVKMIVTEALPQIVSELKEISNSANVLAANPFSVFPLDKGETQCSYNNHLEEDEVDADNGEPRCREPATYVGCWEGWEYSAHPYCKKHMSTEYDWRWYALLPLTIDLLE